MADIVQNVKLKGDSTSLQNASVAGGKAMTAAFAKGQLAAQAALKVITDMVVSIKEGAKFAVEYDKSQQKLIASLQAAGRPVEENVELINQLSSEIQGLTNVSDEVVRDMLSQAIAFGKSTDEADKLVRASFALSNAMGTDVNTAMRELMGTTTGLLGRSVKLVDGIKDLTKAELANGDATDLVLEKMGNLVDVGSRGVSGSLATMGNAWDDLRETIGRAGTEMQAFKDLVTSAIEGVQNLDLMVQSAGVGGLLLPFFDPEGAAEALENQKKLLAAQKAAAQAQLDFITKQREARGEFDFGDEGVGGFEIKAPKVAPPEVEIEIDATTTSFQAGEEVIRAQAEARRALVMELDQTIADGRLELLQSRVEREEQIERTSLEARLTLEEDMANRRNAIVSAAQNFAFNTTLDILTKMADGAEISLEAVAKSFLSSFGKQLIADGIKNVAMGTAALANPLTAEFGPGMISTGQAEIAIGGGMIAGRLALGAATRGGGGGGSTGGGASDFAAGAVRAPGGGGGVGGAPPVINLTFHGPTTKAEVGLALREAMAEADALGV